MRPDFFIKVPQTSNASWGCVKCSRTSVKIIKSKALISELKNFVASGTGYAAKPGEHDDLVMATILAVRMLQQIQNYHKSIGQSMTDHNDSPIEPMPFIMF